MISRNLGDASPPPPSGQLTPSPSTNTPFLSFHIPPLTLPLPRYRFLLMLLLRSSFWVDAILLNQFTSYSIIQLFDSQNGYFAFQKRIDNALRSTAPDAMNI